MPTAFSLPSAAAAATLVLACGYVAPAVADAPYGSTPAPVSVKRYQLACGDEGTNAAFGSVTGLDEATHPTKSASTNDKPTIAFEHGFITSAAFNAWVKTQSPKECTVTMTTTDGTAYAQYRITGAVPAAFSAATPSPSGTDVGSMSFSMTYKTVTKQ